MPDSFARLLSYFGDTFSALLLSSGSIFSLTSLVAALGLALIVVVRRRRARRRRISIGLVLRALFPKRLMTSPSTRADLVCLAANVFVYGAIFAAAVLSSAALAKGVAEGLAAAFGRIGPSILPDFVLRATVTAILFLAYELGYWIDHYLSHRLPILWEFHKVHHSATVLTPLTVWRTHPFDSLVFYNILALTMGLANGASIYAFGGSHATYAVAGNNLLLVLFMHAYVHLQHSELWIAFRGWAGRIFMSPAHHQIHHSTDPKHFNCNFGAALCMWDWAFGTLRMPSREPQRLTFGLEAEGRDWNNVAELSVAPVGRVLAMLAKAPESLGQLPSEEPSRI